MTTYILKCHLNFNLLHPSKINLTHRSWERDIWRKWEHGSLFIHVQWTGVKKRLTTSYFDLFLRKKTVHLLTRNVFVGRTLSYSEHCLKETEIYKENIRGGIASVGTRIADLTIGQQNLFAWNQKCYRKIGRKGNRLIWRQHVSSIQSERCWMQRVKCERKGLIRFLMYSEVANILGAYCTSVYKKWSHSKKT